MNEEEEEENNGYDNGLMIIESVCIRLVKICVLVGRFLLLDLNRTASRVVHNKSRRGKMIYSTGSLAFVSAVHTPFVCRQKE